MLKFDEDTYLHILHYGFDGKYLPIGFDVLFIKDIKKYGAFLDGILASCSTLLNDINLSEPCYDCQKLLQ
jgi:hypothetical protein